MSTTEGSTAPSGQGATERIALDIHAHLVPVEPERVEAFGGVSFDRDDGTLTVDGHRIGVAALYRPEELVAWMDRHRVGRALISAPPPTYREALRGEEAVAWAAYLTTGLQRIADRVPDRLSVLAHVPTADPGAALDAASAALAAGHRHFSLPAGGPGAPALSDPGFAPLWRELDRAAAFAFFHPGECADGRLSAFYLSNLVGNPYETTVAVAHLVFGGVIERYPAIRFGFAHGGGAVALLAGRFARGVETARPGIVSGQASPRDLLRRLCVDCILHDPAGLDLVEEGFGSGQVLFGSDWPFPMGLPEPHEQLAGLSAARRRRIFCDNPLTLFPDLIATRENVPA